ncbi:MAG: T9SS type A sorting domain-containing protein, partial [bacterium]|nr:T9SS type A sorting domain-containing protein [Candidatus Kapabacteria bacterium]
TVGTAPATDGRFTFTPSAFPTKRVRVRLVDVDQPGVSDASDAPFEILTPPSIMIFSPTTGERIMRGATYTISWRAERVQRVNIRFSTDAGVTWSFIASNLDARLGQYVWTVPGNAVSQARIRIEEVGGPTFAESGIFSIVEPLPAVRVLIPNGGERYFIGDAINITWTASDGTPITLSYSSDGGATWTQFAGPMNATLGAFRWNSGLPAGSYRIRIDAGGGIRDDSDGDFRIVRRLAPAIAITYPNGGEVLEIGSAVNIRWTSFDVQGPVAVEYSVDSGRTWKPAGSGITDVQFNVVNWIVPNDPTTNALVRMYLPGAADTSNAVFTIVERPSSSLRVVAPNGGEHWREGDTISVRWISVGVLNVDIQLSTDGGASWTRTIAQNVPAASAQYQLRVPHLADTSLASLLIRISASENPTVWDASNGTFFFDVNLIAGLARDGNATSAHGAHRASPNPFVTSTTIEWMQSHAASVELRIYDQHGALISRNALGAYPTGANSHSLDFESMQSGMYIYQIRVGSMVVHGKLLKQ